MCRYCGEMHPKRANARKSRKGKRKGRSGFGNSSSGLVKVSMQGSVSKQVGGLASKFPTI